MRCSIIIVLFLSSLLMVGRVYASDNELSELNVIAMDVKDAVEREDMNRLMQYVAPSGTYFIDKPYTYAQIDKLISTKGSWLYKHLFVGENSIKDYLNNAKNLKVVINHRDHAAIQISYPSSNYDRLKWIECCFMKINGHWYFDGIFSCQ